MAFRLDDIVIDRILMGVAMDFDDNILYTLTQLSEASIEITAESKESRDKDGTLIKRFWQGKSGTFTATNAMLNLNVIGAMSGQGKELATASNTIAMPAIKVVPVGTETVTLNDDTSTYVASSAKVVGMTFSGAKSETVYTAGTAAGENTYVVSAGGVISLPTAQVDDQYVIYYERTVNSGAYIENRSDKFPSTIKLLLKVLYVDPCTADTVRVGYILLPSFQVSPEVTINLTTDATLDYTGDLQVDYCGSKKVLYQMFFADDDEEEE